MNVSIKPRLLVHPVDVDETDGSDTGLSDETPTMDSCIPLKEMYVQGVAVLPALVASENLFFLLALALYRKKLQHNNVYRYVASALVANFVTSSLGFYHFLNYYHGFEPINPNLWWALRKGEITSFNAQRDDLAVAARPGRRWCDFIYLLVTLLDFNFLCSITVLVIKLTAHVAATTPE